MGFLNRLLGKPDTPPPGGPPGAPAGGDAPDRRLFRDNSKGAPLTADVLAAGPFPRQMRIRAVFEGYALYGSWKVVTLNSADAWPAAQDEVRHAYYQQFGLIRLPDGNSAIRWNEFTWRGILEGLEFRYDPRFRAAESPAPGYSPP